MLDIVCDKSEDIIKINRIIELYHQLKLLKPILTENDRIYSSLIDDLTISIKSIFHIKDSLDKYIFEIYEFDTEIKSDILKETIDITDINLNCCVLMRERYIIKCLIYNPPKIEIVKQKHQTIVKFSYSDDVTTLDKSCEMFNNHERLTQYFTVIKQLLNKLKYNMYLVELIKKITNNTKCIITKTDKQFLDELLKCKSCIDNITKEITAHKLKITELEELNNAINSFKQIELELLDTQEKDKLSLLSLSQITEDKYVANLKSMNDNLINKLKIKIEDCEFTIIENNLLIDELNKQIEDLQHNLDMKTKEFDIIAKSIRNNLDLIIQDIKKQIYDKFDIVLKDVLYNIDDMIYHNLISVISHPLPSIIQSYIDNNEFLSLFTSMFDFNKMYFFVMLCKLAACNVDETFLLCKLNIGRMQTKQYVTINLDASILLYFIKFMYNNSCVFDVVN